MGKASVYPDTYQAEILYPISRAQNRQRLGITTELPFKGTDFWTAYEVSWLNQGGIPQVAIGEFSVPCTSTYMVESKSLKLYLNSLNQTRFASLEAVAKTIRQDLRQCCNAEVGVKIFDLDTYAALGLDRFSGECIDYSLDQMESDLPAEPDPELLKSENSRSGMEIDECLYSNLLKTNCPVTGQPDWASIAIAYRGQPISRAALLAYIVSFRKHQDFHEHCVERIFIDIKQRLAPVELTVYARYTRRGGLDINPCRSTRESAAKSMMNGSGRLVRQ